MWKYYLDVTAYNTAISLLVGGWLAISNYSLAIGLLYGGFFFAVFGTGLGILAFNYFQSNQYYLYHNLGFTRKRLYLLSWLFNALLGIPLIVLALILQAWLN
ncbi:hypothetical protein [Croceiramulus getboli]|nr:hypothetical protein P8624_04435 [Flavobacteriaceae bacterium YJPT1-3]